MDYLEKEDGTPNGTTPTEAELAEQKAKEEEAAAKAKRKEEIEAGNREENLRLRQMVIDAEVSKASQDAKQLLELHKKDPKLADDVARKFNYSSFDEAKKVIEKDSSVAGLIDWKQEDDFDIRYAKKRAAEIHELALKKAEKLLNKLPESQQEIAKEYFDKISLGRTLDEDTALEFAEMATLYVNKDKLKAGKLEEVRENLSSTGLSKSKRPPVDSEPKYELDANGRVVLISNN